MISRSFLQILYHRMPMSHGFVSFNMIASNIAVSENWSRAVYSIQMR